MHICVGLESVASSGPGAWEWDSGIMTAMGVIAAVVVAVTLAIAVVRFVIAQRRHRN